MPTMPSVLLPSLYGNYQSGEIDIFRENQRKTEHPVGAGYSLLTILGNCKQLFICFPKASHNYRKYLQCYLGMTAHQGIKIPGDYYQTLCIFYRHHTGSTGSTIYN